MKLHDRLYLRFGLFHKRWGHAIAYLIEFVLVAIICFFILLLVTGTARWAYEVYSWRDKAAVAQFKQVEAERMLVQCLNGGVVGRTTTGEIIGCEGAMTFRM